MRTLLLALTLFGTASFAAQCLAGDAPLETRILFQSDSAKSWSAPESTMDASSKRVKTHPASLHWHVTVDYNAGEVNYPIGWPRINHAFAESERDWTDWEYLRMWIYTETSRETLPREPVGLALHTPDKISAYTQRLTELKKNEWVEVRIPLSLLPETHEVRLIQLHISESSYQHGDTLDLYIDDLALERHATPVIGELAAETPVMFADARQLPVRFQVLGLRKGAQSDLGYALRHQGQTVAQGTWKVTRDSRRALAEITSFPLPAGAYELVTTISPGGSSASAPLRIVESPWTANRK